MTHTILLSCRIASCFYCTNATCSVRFSKCDTFRLWADCAAIKTLSSLPSESALWVKILVSVYKLTELKRKNFKVQKQAVIISERLVQLIVAMSLRALCSALYNVNMKRNIKRGLFVGRTDISMLLSETGLKQETMEWIIALSASINALHKSEQSPLVSSTFWSPFPVRMPKVTPFWICRVALKCRFLSWTDCSKMIMKQNKLLDVSDHWWVAEKQAVLPTHVFQYRVHVLSRFVVATFVVTTRSWHLLHNTKKSNFTNFCFSQFLNENTYGNRRFEPRIFWSETGSNDRVLPQ